MLIPFAAIIALTLLFASYLAWSAHSTPQPLPIPVKCCECCENQKLEVERPFL